MSETEYKIQPKKIVIEKEAVSFMVRVQELVLNKSATLLITLFNDKEQPVIADGVKLEGDAYNAWSNDDNYIIDYVCQKYGLTLL